MTSDAQEPHWPVAIGKAAELSRVSAKMVRHYESLGLLRALARTDGGYRQYSQADVRTLQFIKRGRDLGEELLAPGLVDALDQSGSGEVCLVGELVARQGVDPGVQGSGQGVDPLGLADAGFSDEEGYDVVVEIVEEALGQCGSDFHSRFLWVVIGCSVVGSLPGRSPDWCGALWCTCRRSMR